MADTRDLKSLVKYLTCGFESRSWHFLIRVKLWVSKFHPDGLLLDLIHDIVRPGQK